MKKYDLARRIAERMGCTNELAFQFLSEYSNTLLDIFAEGEEIRIQDIGTFYISKKDGFCNKNFMGTGEKMYVEPKNRLAFRPHNKVTEVIN